MTRVIRRGSSALARMRAKREEENTWPLDREKKERGWLLARSPPATPPSSKSAPLSATSVREGGNEARAWSTGNGGDAISSSSADDVGVMRTDAFLASARPAINASGVASSGRSSEVNAIRDRHRHHEGEQAPVRVDHDAPELYQLAHPFVKSLPNGRKLATRARSLTCRRGFRI